MRLMKKDMGGAAHALALAQLVMAQRLPVRLHLLIPAVENAVSGGAFRPGDVVDVAQGPARSKSTIPTPKGGWCSPTRSTAQPRTSPT